MRTGAGNALEVVGWNPCEESVLVAGCRLGLAVFGQYLLVLAV